MLILQTILQANCDNNNKEFLVNVLEMHIFLSIILISEDHVLPQQNATGQSREILKLLRVEIGFRK